MSQPQLNLGDLSKATVPLPGLNPIKEDKPSSFWTSNPLYSMVSNVSNSITSHRNSLDLINPGTMENINKEVSRDVFLSQLSFQGLRADLSKTFSFSPTFQVSHSFTMGGQAAPYSLNAIFGNEATFAQASIDNEFNLTGRLNHAWDKHIISKLTLQLSDSQQSMVQMEHDYQAHDFSLNFKALNPDVFGNSLSGVYVGSILQSITPKFSLGVESVYSAMQPGVVGDASISLYGRYDNKNWIASTQLLGSGQLIGSFWKKLAPNVEAGIETTLAAGVKPVLNELMQPVYQTFVEANTTIGAKYEYRQSVYRGQVDSNGVVSVLMEHRVLPTLGLLFNASIDQLKNTAKLGAGLQIEVAGSEEIMMMQNGLIDANGNPVQGAPIA